jgi:AcrR family transcriptional regulator
VADDAGAQPSAERKRAIMDAALALFARRGYHGASMAAIADAVGVSKAGLYWHFRSKADLFRAVFAEQVDRAIHSQLPAAGAAAQPTATLRAIVDGIVRHALEEPDGYRVLVQLAVEPQVAALVGDVMDAELSAWQGALAPAFAALGDPQPELAAHVFAATLDGLALQVLADPDVATNSELIDAVVARAAAHATGGATEGRRA